MRSGTESIPAWEQELHKRLPLFGHRNWIVVADFAYPAQSQPGIETIATCSTHLQAVSAVLEAVTAYRHIRANIYTDMELGYVQETDAPGIAAYLCELDALLEGCSRQQLPHEQIIARLDQAAQCFCILIVKTEMTIPYTSVFFELDCGYWSAEAEVRLRKSMRAE